MQKNDNSNYPIGSPAVKPKNADGAVNPSTENSSRPTSTSAAAPTSLQVSVSKSLNVSKVFKDFKTQSLPGFDDNLVIDNLRTAAIAIARKIAGKFPDWRIIFELARELQGVPGARDLEAPLLKPAVIAFHSEINLGMSVDDCWIKFLSHWGEIHTPVGSNPLREAFKHVREDPNPITIADLPPTKNDDLVTIARVACELSKERQVFYRQQKDIAEELSRNGERREQRTVSDLIKILCAPAIGVLNCIYRGKGPGDGNKYVAGPALLALREQPAQLKLVVSKPIDPNSTAVHGKENKYDRLGRKKKKATLDGGNEGTDPPWR